MGPFAVPICPVPPPLPPSPPHAVTSSGVTRFQANNNNNNNNKSDKAPISFSIPSLAAVSRKPVNMPTFDQLLVNSFTAVSKNQSDHRLKLDSAQRRSDFSSRREPPGVQFSSRGDDSYKKKVDLWMQHEGGCNEPSDDPGRMPLTPDRTPDSDRDSPGTSDTIPSSAGAIAYERSAAGDTSPHSLGKVLSPRMAEDNIPAFKFTDNLNKDNEHVNNNHSFVDSYFQKMEEEKKAKEGKRKETNTQNRSSRKGRSSGDKKSPAQEKKRKQEDVQNFFSSSHYTIITSLFECLLNKYIAKLPE